MPPHKLEVGQKLWYVPEHGRPHEITVEKTGRLYAHSGRNRISLETLTVMQGDYEFGRCYLDRAVYEADQQRKKAWRALKCGIQGIVGYPSGIPLESIRQAADLLGIALEAQEKMQDRF